MKREYVAQNEKKIYKQKKTGRDKINRTRKKKKKVK